MKNMRLLSLLLVAACAPSLDWRDVRLDGAKLQMPCKPDLVQRDARVGAQLFSVRMHVCDAAGLSWAVLDVDVRDVALAATARADLQRSLQANLEAGAGAASDAGRWQWLRGRRADGSPAVASVSYAVDGARVVQRVALLPREPGAADTQALELFHAPVSWSAR